MTGTVDSESLQISLSNSTVFADDSTNSHYFTAVGLSSTQYLLLFYNGSSADEDFKYYNYGPVQTILATVPDDVDPVNANITLGSTVTLESSAATFGLAATRIDDTTAVLAYANVAENYAVQAQVVQLLSEASVAETGETTYETFPGARLFLLQYSSTSKFGAWGSIFLLNLLNFVDFELSLCILLILSCHLSVIP